MKKSLLNNSQSVAHVINFSKEETSFLAERFSVNVNLLFCVSEPIPIWNPYKILKWVL